MKPKLTSQIALTTMLALASVVSHAANEPKARVLRLRLNEGSATWRMSVNGQDLGQGLRSGNLTNQLTELSLRHGDVLILSLPQHKFEPPVQRAKEWLSRYCQSNHVAIYIYGNTEFKPNNDMFSVAAYHWIAPFDDPFNLSGASFFREGRFLGSGTNGFRAMLAGIKEEEPGVLFILGSMYDMDRSFPSEPTPYEALHGELEKVLRGRRIRQLHLDALPAF